MTDISPELVSRMVALVRAYAANGPSAGLGPDRNRSVYAEAQAIVSELPAPPQ